MYQSDFPALAERWQPVHFDVVFYSSIFHVTDFIVAGPAAGRGSRAQADRRQGLLRTAHPRGLEPYVTGSASRCGVRRDE
jgi:hypothetical protein